MFRIMKTDADCFDTDMNAALRTGIEFVFGAFGNAIVFFILGLKDFVAGAVFGEVRG